FDAAPPNGTNTGRAVASGLGTFDGQATIDFAHTDPTLVNGCIDATDTIGTLGTVCSTDVSPKVYTYSNVVTAPSGTCHTIDNTGSFTIGTNPTSSATSVKVCGGADLTVSKTANPTFKRKYDWTITKDVDNTLIKQSGTSATFNYTVTASETGVVDS